MSPVNLSSLLSYGAIGLGCALALFSFWLLQREQKIKTPRKEMLRAIYVFMVFAFALALTGFAAEFLKTEREKAYSLASQNGEAIQKLKSSSHQLRSLMEIKGGAIKRLRTALEASKEQGKSIDPAYQNDLLRNIEESIDSVDKQIEVAIKDLDTSSQP